MNVADTIKKFGLEQAFDYLYRDPERNLLKIMDWADRFDNGDFAVQRKVIRQGKELGVYMYIYTGGEPLVRKDDLIRLCEKHSDCVFLCFTNGTLIDESFADEMLPSPWQREAVYCRIRRLRAEKPLFAMGFQNDAEYMGGCIAGGKRYLHINANGDVDPCVFIHYSDSNIREKSLLECLQSPMFMAYHDNQPFNENMLRPCPMLENPEFIEKMVHETGAHSTDPQSPESVEHLTAKTHPYADNWTPMADKLWSESHPGCAGCAGCGSTGCGQ